MSQYNFRTPAHDIASSNGNGTVVVVGNTAATSVGNLDTATTGAGTMTAFTNHEHGRHAPEDVDGIESYPAEDTQLVPDTDHNAQGRATIKSGRTPV